MGKVFLVGAGPGNPKLITVEGAEILRKADVVIYDYLANNELLQLVKPGAEIIYVGKQASQHELPQEDINDLLVKKAYNNNIVVRLKGGDPFIFGRGGEEASYLVGKCIDYEVVPGISSAISAPAYAGIPLTYRGYASTVAFVTGHEDEKKETSSIRWHELANGVDTIVFLMGMKNLGEITNRLMHEGKNPETPAAIVRWGTLPQQKTITGTIASIHATAILENLGPPAVIIVGSVVGLRQTLRWFENKPLIGYKVALTRAPHQLAKMADLLREKGAETISLPTIEILAIKENSNLIESIERITAYDYLIFTSVNGVSIFFEYLLKTGRDARVLGGLHIIPIGPATAEALRERNILADSIPETYTSEGIVEVLKKHVLSGKKVLIPRAETARDIVPRYVENCGGECHVVPVYRTSLPATPLPAARKPDIVTFTSSSTVDNFMKLYGNDILEDTLIASIGPVTSGTLNKYGIIPQIEASQNDVSGLVNAIEEYVLKSKK